MKQFLISLLTFGATSISVHSADPTDAELIERGKAVAQATFKELSGQLIQAMAKGGPTNAIEFCSVEAPPLTRKVAQAEGVAIHRVSHRPRNPDNAANELERELVARITNSLAAKEAPIPIIHREDTGSVTFYAPITINNPLCLSCHGDPSKEIAADTLLLIQKKYPKDQATGFALNDVRGLWRIEFTPATAR